MYGSSPTPELAKAILDDMYRYAEGRRMVTKTRGDRWRRRSRDDDDAPREQPIAALTMDLAPAD